MHLIWVKMAFWFFKYVDFRMIHDLSLNVLICPIFDAKQEKRRQQIFLGVCGHQKQYTSCFFNVPF